MANSVKYNEGGGVRTFDTYSTYRRQNLKKGSIALDIFEPIQWITVWEI